MCLMHKLQAVVSDRVGVWVRVLVRVRVGVVGLWGYRDMGL